ncbi:iron-containing alcohol dehydrogenase family protein [Serpentinicella alkaliphila]|uniref:Glycerol dehydrogenase n=1 Tax=Serpentinicella alkaliphila TaxID=1734049 RepID=A0A4R2TAM0_9FIRM|nr:iron-containing alcohol dehydrogenase family protein [Serpentinicella alkaliphila]QUH25808.1 iron-containing alcohol dehydrogenase family protein [Serpentinicella alkaliphila]TCP99820.1 glycerol dehydrogenase [Serpentinicella alkaliphila]
MIRATVKFPSYTIQEDALLTVGGVIKSYGQRVLIVGGKIALEKAQEKLRKSLDENKLEIVDFMWYGGECTYSNIDKIVEKAKNESVDIIVGVGGGKALDTSKAAAEGAGIPSVTIPTTAATCAATTPLSIIYTEKGDFEALLHLSSPPVHIFMDSIIIADAPTKYLWAGIGDTIAKYYEVRLTTRGKKLSHSPAMAKELSVMCLEPLLEYGRKALEDSDNKIASYELEQVILNNIISTGIVSMLVGDENNGAIAHGTFYGFTLLEEIEKHHLHGEVVAYGVLLLLAIDKQEEELERLIAFYKEIKLPISLKDLGVKNDRAYLDGVLEKAINAPDMKKVPYIVTKDMLFEAMQKLEALKG